MTNNERRKYEAMVRIRDFGDVHRDLFPKSTPGGKLFAKVGAAVESLSLHAVSKLSAHGAALDGASARRVAREALRERLDSIVRTARMMADDVPELAGKFRFPDNPTDQALLTAARLVARDAEAFKADFVAHALPKTFLADFSAATEKLAQALHDRDAGRDEHLAARAGIDEALTSGWEAVRKLDVLAANRLHDDPVAMAVWERDRRVDYGARSRSPEVTPQPAEPASAGPVSAPTAATPTPAPQVTATQTTA